MQPDHTTDLLVIGAGGAGMYAALAAAAEGLSVVLVEKSLPGRSGATVMAQMTVAAALGHEEPDDWTLHFQDSLRGGRGICYAPMTELMCREAPERMLELAELGTRWARRGERLLQVAAPGHSRRRCIWAGTLGTGLSISRALREAVEADSRITVWQDTFVTDLIVEAPGKDVPGREASRRGASGQEAGRVVRGAVVLDVATGALRSVAAAAVVLATGGCTELFRRTTASRNMTGDGYWLALRAGCELRDAEFVQYFPIATLYPPLPGFDPVMWDPFRYKLGGRLYNAAGQDFLQEGSDEGRRGDEVYRHPRDVVADAIFREVAAGRGSPHGGAYLDFSHIPRQRLVDAFGPVIRRLEEVGLDLTREPVEVAPSAHYTMGGVNVDATLQTSVRGLFAGGETVGGTHGANRLSGNGVTEAVVLGHAVGRYAARYIRDRRVEAREAAAPPAAAWPAALDRKLRERARSVLADRPEGPTAGAVLRELKALMWDLAGPVRSQERLLRAEESIRRLREEVLPRVFAPKIDRFNLAWVERLELEGALDVAEAIVVAARERRESRGAHQREDYPATDPDFERNTIVRRVNGGLKLDWVPVTRP